MPYTTAADVASRWRPLTPGEEAVAVVLIGDVEDMIASRWPDLTGRVESGSVSETTVIRVVAGAVRRAMMNRDSEGVTQEAQTVGPFSRSASFANPNGNLYLSAEDVQALGGDVVRARVGWLA